MQLRKEVDERWIFENPKILESIKRGVEQSAQGQVVDLGSFAHYLTGRG